MTTVLISLLKLQVGQALKKLFEDGVLKREDMFITSKLWWVFLFLLEEILGV